MVRRVFFAVALCLFLSARAPANGGSSSAPIRDLSPIWSEACNQCKQSGQDAFNRCIKTAGGANEITLGLCVTQKVSVENQCLIQHNCSDPFTTKTR